MNYRIKIHHKSGKFYIQEEQKFWRFTKWSDVGHHIGSVAGIFFEVDYYKTEEEAIQKIIKLTKEDKELQKQNNQIKKKVEKFKEISISTEDIKEKFPEHFL